MNRNMKFVIMLLLVISLVFPFFAGAESLSELDIQQFEKGKPVSSEGGLTSSPFTPARNSPQELIVEDLFLSGVAIGGGKTFVLISGYILEQGDFIAGLKIRSITRDKVILQHLDRVHTLNLGGGS